ncbi:MAG: matrixin family metalloprotease [Planctomycetaceae bacterium]|nr:matrixin family metalloprotease [Planctomycetaceae bacterium]
MKKVELEKLLEQIARLVSTFDSGGEDEETDRDDSSRITKDRSRAVRHNRIDPAAFARRRAGDAFSIADRQTHKLGHEIICSTDERGYATPQNRSPAELVIHAIHASEGFIPLWTKGVTLRWRFNEVSMGFFQDPEAAKSGIRDLLRDAVAAWGDAAPIGFNELRDAYDFEIVMRESDRCNINGCVLASAFFPDAGRHELVIYPKMFTQDKEEQVETLVHEIGHIFGLRHFFAAVHESQWPSVIFGAHKPFSIMNYGEESELTEDDKADLKRLYQAVWSGELTEINGTPIRLVEPFHAAGRIAFPASIAAKRI